MSPKNCHLFHHTQYHTQKKRKTEQLKISVFVSDLEYATSLFRLISMHKMMKIVYSRCIISTSSSVFANHRRSSRHGIIFFLFPLHCNNTTFWFFDSDPAQSFNILVILFSRFQVQRVRSNRVCLFHDAYLASFYRVAACSRVQQN